MKTPRRLHLILTLAMVSAMTTAIVAGAAIQRDPAGHPEQFTGSLVNIERGARFSRPFILHVDHYATDGEVQRMTGILAAKGPYSLRDELWKEQVGYLSIGGGIGLPVAAVLEQDTSTGRTLRVVLNRRLSTFEVQNYTRSSKYPFTVIELHLDQNGRGEGFMVGAAQMRLSGDTLTVKSLGNLPVRLLAVRAS